MLRIARVPSVDSVDPALSASGGPSPFWFRINPLAAQPRSWLGGQPLRDSVGTDAERLADEAEERSGGWARIVREATARYSQTG
jgi:hypothetical protein